uniref:Uncharacterized protein n=1 Tax=Panagrolaimus davidi TaxID=227884 RepID=A0A914PVK8_9BILA
MTNKKSDSTVLLSIQKPRYLTFYISANIPDIYETTDDDEYDIIGYNEEDSICENEINQTHGKEISTNRNVLTEFSNILPQILKQTPTYLNIADFNGDTTQAAVDFMNGNIDAIKGKEFEVCKFAVTYDIQKLINACRLSLEESVNPSNV